MKQELRKGTLLDRGRYRIESFLGQGGFGITYLATDLIFDRLVAIKELFPGLFCHRDTVTSNLVVGGSGNEQQMEKLKKQFLKEANHLESLCHNGIVRVYGSFQQFNTAYYVMNYIKGHTLSYIVKEKGPFNTANAIRIISQIADSLNYLHGVHINHLDIKPANIIIRESDKKPVLIDFGLSLHFDKEDGPTCTMPYGVSDGFAGKEQYIQNAVRSFSPPTDIYSLGATLYYMVTGQTPKSSLHREDDNDLYFPISVSERLKYPILKAMALSKFNRFQTVTEFKNALISSSFVSNQGEPKEDTINMNPVNSPGKKKGQSWTPWLWVVGVIAIIGCIIYLNIDITDQNDYATLPQIQQDDTSNILELMIEEVSLDDTIVNETSTNSRSHAGQNSTPSPTFNYYDEGFSKFRLPSSFVFKGQSEEDLEEKFFSDGTAEFLTTSTPTKYVNLEDPFRTVIENTIADSSPYYLIDRPNLKIASGYGFDGKIYYTKWVIRDGTVYMGTLIYPENKKSKYESMISDIFDYYGTPN